MPAKLVLILMKLAPAKLAQVEPMRSILIKLDKPARTPAGSRELVSIELTELMMANLSGLMLKAEKP